jgi:sugar lactone lactonase YvrE
LPASAVADTVDPAPTQVLDTGYAVFGVARNPANGNLYVSDSDSKAIHVYAGDASGSTAPLTSFPLSCVPWQITFNPAGSAMLVACTTQVLELAPDTGAVLHAWTGMSQARAAVYDGGGQVFAADLSGNAVRRFDASTDGAGTLALVGSEPSTKLDDPAGIAFAGGILYVANNGNDTVTEYELTPGTSPSSTPLRTLTLPADVNETESVTLDDAGNLYAGAISGGVLVYPAGASGAATPTRRLTGPNTGPGTTDVDVLPNRSVLVGQLAIGGPRVAVFPALVPLPPPPLPPAAAPGAVTGLKVAGSKSDRKRTVTWAAGAAGTSAVTSYSVVVTKGKKQLFAKTTTSPSVKLKVKKLKAKGKLTVTVSATSAVGTGPPASTTFKVMLPKPGA